MLDPVCSTASVITLTGPSKYVVTHLVNSNSVLCKTEGTKAYSFIRQAIQPSGTTAYVWNAGETSTNVVFTRLTVVPLQEDMSYLSHYRVAARAQPK